MKNPIRLNPLTQEEARIILEKGTEPPFSGKYYLHRDRGVYVCRQCDTPLFLSEAKFDSWCGWPSFDEAIPGRVKWLPDADGRRTEIVCATCDAHLGHVFIGEKITKKNTRHCVNSLSMKFSTDVPSDLPDYRRAYFAWGCFWCIEAVFKRLRWVVEVHSGYVGGKIPFPTYQTVSLGNTGHIETVEVVYDPALISYETLLSVFFASHDPTTRDQQWHDAGERYRSVVFWEDTDLEQARAFIANLESEKTFENPIVTDLRPKDVFYIAETYHQDYYDQNPTKAYCNVVIDPKIRKLRKNFAEYLK